MAHAVSVVSVPRCQGAPRVSCAAAASSDSPPMRAGAWLGLSRVQRVRSKAGVVRSVAGSRISHKAGAVRAEATTQVHAPITFQIGETSLSLPFSSSQAQALDAAISALLTTFREKEKATRPQRWATMEYRYKGDVTQGEVFVEVFCNPNAYANAFQAKALITVRDDRIKFTSEGALSAVKASVDEYLTKHA